MSRIYHQEGNTFWPTSDEALAIRDRLAPGTYTVAHHKLRGFYLTRVEDFTLPAKLYGDVDHQANRIISTFLARDSGTGVLLSGQKGGGKTMLTKRVSQLGVSLYDIPTVIVNEPFCGDEFNAFIGGMDQPVIVVIDEFEKLFDREKQPLLLTLFDGIYSSKKLFMLTCNDRHRIDSHMLNRPGRLYYALDFKGLSREFIEEYCLDRLANQANLKGVVNVSAFFGEFSFDMLQALVEEMNRYDETATQAMQMLNMRPQLEDTASYEVAAFREGKKIVCESHYPDTVRQNPLSLDGLEVTLYGFDKGEEPEDGITRNESYRVDLNKLNKLDRENGVFIFSTDEPGVTLRFKRVKSAAMAMNYDAF